MYSFDFCSSANLNLPKSWTMKEKLERVDQIAAQLGLTKHMNTVVGNGLTGVSFLYIEK